MLGFLGLFLFSQWAVSYSPLASPMTYRPTPLTSVYHQPNSRPIRPAACSTSPLGHFTNISSVMYPNLNSCPSPKPALPHFRITGTPRAGDKTIMTLPFPQQLTAAALPSARVLSLNSGMRPLVSPSLHNPSPSRLDLHLLLAAQPPSLLPTYHGPHSSQNGLPAQVRLDPSLFRQNPPSLRPQVIWLPPPWLSPLHSPALAVLTTPGGRTCTFLLT